MDILYIIIPAYNEAENINKVIEDWYPIVERYNGNGKSRLIIINDGSQDNTYEMTCKNSVDKPMLVPISKENSGHGATVLYGYNYAIEKGADYIFQTDSDGQTLASEFHQFWEVRKNYDMVIGWRNKRQDGKIRVCITQILRLVIRICFKINVLDANTPYRLISRNALKKVIIQIPKEFNLSNVLLTVLLEKNNMRVKYVPITFRPRQGGKNSINIKNITRIGQKAFRDFLVLNKRFSNSK